jgi:hypothetical protein
MWKYIGNILPGVESTAWKAKTARGDEDGCNKAVAICLSLKQNLKGRA